MKQLSKWLPTLALAGTVLVLAACQGSNPNVSNPQPRSRQAAGDREELPYEEDLGNTLAVDSDGGEVEFRLARLVIPRGALPEVVFVEIAVPEEVQRDVLVDTAYQISPTGVGLEKDALLRIGFYDDDVPAGREETDLVIVHKVNNVWVELSNSEVDIHSNTVTAPIRYLGIYALRAASEDPRRVNTPPVAIFNFSAEPFADQYGTDPSEASGPPPADPDRANGEPGYQDLDGNSFKLNINEANIDGLAELPGVSRELAMAIVENRSQYGEFRTLADLTRVPGMTNDMYDNVVPFISLLKDEPLIGSSGLQESQPDQLVNINTASALELATLPGLDDVLSQRIVDYRNRNGPFSNTGQLVNINGIGDVSIQEMLPHVTVSEQSAGGGTAGGGEAGQVEQEGAPREQERSEVQGLLMINSARESDMAQIPFISEELAREIVKYRSMQGYIDNEEELASIEGMTPEILSQLLPLISFEIPLQGGARSQIIERRVVGALQAGGANAAEREASEEPGTGAGNVAEGEGPGADEPPLMVAGDDEEPISPESGTQVTVYFSAAESYDPDGEVVQYDWDFDSDGVFDYTSHSSPYAEHTYTYNGDYTVTLKVTDNGRYTQWGYTTGLLRVRNAQAPPKELAAHINAFPRFGPDPLTSFLTATVSGGTPPYDYDWTFSDGSTSNLANPYTTYTECDTHLVNFTVTDMRGESLSGSVYIEVLPSEHPRTPQPRMTLDVSPSTQRGYAPMTAKFSLKAERGTPPITYRVMYGDEPDGADPLITEHPILSHEYAASGFYLLKVIATDADLRTASTFATVHITPPESARDFTIAERAAAGDPFSFGHDMEIRPDITLASSRTVKFYPENAPRELSSMALQWDFGDGTFSTDTKPEHTYARDGIYEVRLSASDGTQRWRTRLWLPVSGQEPTVAIQRPAYIEGPAPLQLALDAIVTRAEEPLRYDWLIDGSRRSDAATVYTFREPGEYEIGLTVYDENNQPIEAPGITVQVRNLASDYRLPLAVVQPLSGSTRAVMLDYTAANPQPYSSPSEEGPVADVRLSANGQYLALAGGDWLLIKRVNDAVPVLSFLPANGELVAVRALDGGRAYATVDTATGYVTYLLRPDSEPVVVGEGIIEATSGAGEVLVLRAGPDDLAEGFQYAIDAANGQVGKPTSLGGIREAALPSDGRELWLVDAQGRLLRRSLADGSDEYYGSRDDLKRALTVSADGSAVAFVSSLGGDEDVIYGRYTDGDEFRLASVTAQTGWFSGYLALSADGRYLLSYGSRYNLSELLAAAKGLPSVGEDEQPSREVLEDLEPEGQGEDAEFYASPPSRRERFGIVRLDLAMSPHEWSITKVNPKFLVECDAEFTSAGPFN